MKPLRVIIGCEKSGVIRRAFRALGHDAWSCDLLPAEDDSEFHLRCDVFSLHREFDVTRAGNWDVGIFHPVCRRLANSGVLRLYRESKKVNGIDPTKWEELHTAAAFFKSFLELPIAHLCVENPVQHCHAKKLIGVEPTQTIQPYEYGHPESKRTCLWLRGLPKLVPTKILPLPPCGYWANQTPSGQNRLSPGPAREAIRSTTYKGIAEAMATQWTTYLASSFNFSESTAPKPLTT